MVEPRARWLEVAGNRDEWLRLHRALELEDGFALFVVDVPDPRTEERVVGLLAEEYEGIEVLDARATGEDAPVRALLRGTGQIAVLRSVEASRWDIEGLERCLVQLNARRDQIAAQGGRLVLVLRRDAVERMLDVAPDLYSVHRARFRFARLEDPWSEPRWLISAAEYAALVDDGGGPFAARHEHYTRLFIHYPRRFTWPDDAKSWLCAPGPASESTAARIVAMREGLRSFAEPKAPDLASMLAAPAMLDEPLLRQHLEQALSANDEHVAALCRLGLAWLSLPRQPLDGAREPLTLDTVSLPLRTELLQTCTFVHNGLVPTSLLDGSVGWLWDLNLLVDLYLTQSAILWEWLPGEHPEIRLSEALAQTIDGNLWRHHTTLASLPPDLLRSAQLDPSPWLRERATKNDAAWPRTWDRAFTIAHALDDHPRLQSLRELAHTWLTTPKRRDIYEVWHPLVDTDAPTRDHLARLPLDPAEATTLFGPRLPAALHVVADLLDRGLLVLSQSEAQALRTRAAARHHLPLVLRTGWWAIEQALL
ncbi:MAG: hypothetical protein KC457_04330 [Myxococcales bacterium]|nr:hypothetical protein [Myxococcales bacterium]